MLNLIPISDIDTHLAYFSNVIETFVKGHTIPSCFLYILNNWGMQRRKYLIHDVTSGLIFLHLEFLQYQISFEHSFKKFCYRFTWPTRLTSFHHVKKTPQYLGIHCIIYDVWYLRLSFGTWCNNFLNHFNIRWWWPFEKASDLIFVPLFQLINVSLPSIMGESIVLVPLEAIQLS